MNTATVADKISYRNTPADLYGQLVAAFGEKEHNGTRWVAIGAGRTALIFFAPREGDDQ